MVAGDDEVAGPVVEHEDVLAHGDDGVRAAAARGDEVLEDGGLAASDVLAQALLDLLRGDRRRRHEERAGVLAPAREVEDADDPARHRVPDRDGGAGEVLEALGPVLGADDVRRAAALQRGADAVRADVPLGVREAGGQPDPVEVLLERGVAGEALEDGAVVVAEDEADRLGREEVGGRLDDGAGGVEQRGRAVAVVLLPEVDPVGGDVVLPGAGPGREDRRPDGSRDRLVGEERRSGVRRREDRVFPHGVPR